jgi:hypothetical protein
VVAIDFADWVHRYGHLAGTRNARGELLPGGGVQSAELYSEIGSTPAGFSRLRFASHGPSPWDRDIVRPKIDLGTSVDVLCVSRAVAVDFADWVHRYGHFAGTRNARGDSLPRGGVESAEMYNEFRRTPAGFSRLRFASHGPSPWDCDIVRRKSTKAVAMR